MMMEGEEFAMSLDLQMQNEIEFLRSLEKIEKEPKGMKAVLPERGLWCPGMLLICRDETK